MKNDTSVKSTIGKLPPDQRAKVDSWLFNEKLTYEQIMERCEKEFNLDVSISAISRYFQNSPIPLLSNRTGTEAGDFGASAWRLGISADELYRDLVEGTGQMALREVRTTRKTIGLSRLVQMLRLQISARREANEAQRVALAREKMEFDAATSCLLHQMEIQKVAADPVLSEADRIRAIRLELFGSDLPK